MESWEINLFAALVLLIILDRGKTALLNADQKHLKKAALLTAALLGAQALSQALESFFAAPTAGVRRALGYLCGVLLLLPGYYAMLHCTHQLSERSFCRCRRWLTLPLVLGGVLLLGHGAGWSLPGRGSGGELSAALLWLAAAPLAAALGVTLYRLHGAAHYQRRQYRQLALFAALPLGGAAAGQWTGTAAIFPLALTLALLLRFVNIQNDNLATDSLTGLNNRCRYDSYSGWKWHTLGAEDVMYVAVLDINKFKRINDTYGHAEGDRAIILAAEAIKLAMDNEKGFVARIGGDEFSLILTGVSEAKVRELLQRIHLLLEETCRRAGLKYRLTFSVGYAFTTGAEKTTFSRLFAQADQAMYKAKKSHY